MTQPGYVKPVKPGWWPRTNRVGVSLGNQIGWDFTAQGSAAQVGSGTGAYNWAGSSTGVSPSVVYVSANPSATTSVTIPTHQAGDLILIWAFNNASTTVATKPSAGGTVPAWVDIDNSIGGNNNAARTAWFTATASTTTSGTWTNATAMIAVVLRGQAVSPIGGHAITYSADTLQSIAPSVTLSQTDGTSAILHFLGSRTNTTWSAAPAGYTQRINTGPATLLTKDVTTSDGSVANAHTSTSPFSGYTGATIEIVC